MAELESDGKVREDASGTNVSSEIKRSEIGYICIKQDMKVEAENICIM